MAYIQSSTEDLWALAAVTVVSGVLISMFLQAVSFYDVRCGSGADLWSSVEVGQNRFFP